MPIYEYRCESCRRKFEVLNRSFSEIKEPVCTHCGAAGGARVMSPRDRHQKLGRLHGRYAFLGLHERF